MAADLELTSSRSSRAPLLSPGSLRRTTSTASSTRAIVDGGSILQLPREPAAAGASPAVGTPAAHSDDTQETMNDDTLHTISPPRSLSVHFTPEEKPSAPAPAPAFAPRGTPVALVTGCSSPRSLGAVLVRKLIRKNYAVFGCVPPWDRDKLTDWITAEGIYGVHVLAFDLTDLESIEGAAQVVKKATGRIDVLINSAAVEAHAPLADTDPTAFRKMLDVHAVAPLALAQAFLPLLLAAPDFAKPMEKPRGPAHPTIVNVGSGNAYGLPSFGAYGASKAANHVLSDVLRRELKHFGIHVLTVVLGDTQPDPTTPESASGVKRAAPSGLYDWERIEMSHATFVHGLARGAARPEIPAQAILAELDRPSWRGGPRGRLWTGGRSSYLRYVIPSVPWRVLDWMSEKRSPLIGSTRVPGGPAAAVAAAGMRRASSIGSAGSAGSVSSVESVSSTAGVAVAPTGLASTGPVVGLAAGPGAHPANVGANTALANPADIGPTDPAPLSPTDTALKGPIDTTSASVHPPAPATATSVAPTPVLAA